MLVLTGSCNETMQTIEVTRLVPNTVGVTEANHQLNYTQESYSLAATPDISATSPSIKIQTDSSSITMDPVYFDGLVVLAQYYTLLGHRLYEESYQLLSSSQQNRYSFEEYKNFYTQDMKALEIRGIQPYDYWRAQQGLSASPIPANELRYVVFLTSFHSGAAWNEGGTPIPRNVTGFESLVLENGEWKIDEFNTSPWFSQP